MFVVSRDTKISKAYNSDLYAKSKKLANPDAVRLLIGRQPKPKLNDAISKFQL